MGINCCSGKNDVYRSFYHQESQQFFDNYTFGHSIGRGSSGEVKLAFHNTTHKKVAVKIFDKAESIKSSTFQRIMSQKLILQQLSANTKFPFISHLIECSQDRSHLYMVMEYFENGNLRQLIEAKKSFNTEQLRFITICLLLTLKFLHDRKVIHGDIKPQNILIDEKGYFCMVDFSSAMRYGCHGYDVKGTKGYRGPQLTTQNRNKLFDNKSDLYSLGTVLWQMAYGVPYLQYKNHQRKASLQNQGTVDSSSEKSVNCFVEDQNFNNFIQLLLKQNSNDRPSVSSLFAHPWLNFSPSLKMKFIQKQVAPHPFQPLNLNFSKDKKLTSALLSKSNRDSLQCEEQLYDSVLLSQRKYQRMFSSFTQKTKQLTHLRDQNHHI